MKVSLVSVTKPEFPELADGTPEDLITYCARVSNPANQLNTETSPRLLRYLIQHKHWSPFEMVDMTVEIETSRAIASQLLRHRSFSFQEFSQRYSTIGAGYECVQARRQDAKNRQNSFDDLPDDIKEWFRDTQEWFWDRAYEAYGEALDKGVAKECARFLLPLSTTTRLYMKGSVRSWIHYLQVRLDPSTQKEHRDVAEAIAKIFEEQFPNVAAALKDERSSDSEDDYVPVIKPRGGR